MNLPLLEELLKYNDEGNLLLSMPGNKGGIGFARDEIGLKFANRMGFLDITEVDPLDNLHYPEGIIKEAQELLAKTYKAKKAYFLVNGSSSGNLAAMFSAFDEGDEVLVERNCHKSIYNGLIMRKLKVKYIEPIIDDELGLFLPPNKENIYKALENSSKPKGIIITYPNYFGITYDIEEVICNLKEIGLKVIIDCAHGAHFGINKRLPKSLASLGDYVVLSAHKTLPALTQGAYLLVNEDDCMIDFYIKSFTTTSPSYLIMASLDYARHYLDTYGKDDYETLINEAEKWKKKINELGKVYILSESDLYRHNDRIEGYKIDPSRYIVILPKGYNGHKFLDYLRDNKIQAEMSFSRGVVLILSPFNTEEDFKIIYETILNLDMRNMSREIEIKYFRNIPVKKFEPYETFKLKSRWCEIEKCEGLVAKESIIPYPPGIPLVCPGEIISKDVIAIVRDYIVNKKSIIGVKNNKIQILDIN
ncbi:aminotransferase class I/II-fold pyridoxal phosphate-dependent enzyme [Clostridium beijerinckii]|uniref:Aminotransferase class I/II-fold pyridoxal phosphate-dependent enzyme n=1 Tax=Clostridium beijerinckii TaxID=1520 RepID=A0A7X9XNF4_CLOBE|nr:aminotransferase class I/II-fold pyridoxal phosphate-dependent enzyme [Clostridium beijerinckii]NMF04115.1 aminotransferase class I/II-fold pyridoxal phosphate-dependent enzyme [Clostridium beijerinckii]